MIRFMSRLAFLLLLAACASPTASTDGEWFGEMTPDHAGPNCPLSRASLVSKHASVLFTPNEGKQTLTGVVTPEGPVTASRSTTGADKKPYTATLAAKVEDSSITGTYRTLRCQYAVRLRRS